MQEADMSRCRAVVHTGDGAVQEIDPRNIAEVLVEKGTLLWLDIEDPTPEEIELLRREFDFHELALEDTLRRGQRPKVDEYEGYYFIVMYTVSCNTTAAVQVATHEVHCFWGTNYFVSLHEDPIPEIKSAIERWEKTPERRHQGVAFQVYALFDAVVDSYFPVLDVMADRIEDVEQGVFTRVEPRLLRAIFALRRELIAVRRVMGPTRDLLNELIRRDVPVFPRSLIPYLSDVYDHSIRVIDALDLQRDLLSSAMESYLSMTSNRLNQTMKTLTALTVGLMLPTLIAGIYGENFDNIPELHWGYGYQFSLALMLVSIVAVFVVFKRIGWW
jgi:magnesium transporter